MAILMHGVGKKIQMTVAGIFAGLVLTACASQPTSDLSWLDPQTGVTVTRAAEYVVFARDNSAMAAYARDFAYMGPVGVNRSGMREYYIWVGLWGSMRPDLTEVRDAFESITIVVDGEPMPLEVAGWTNGSIGVSRPVYLHPVAAGADAYYPVTIDQIRMIAEAGTVEIRAGGMSGVYLPWQTLDSAAFRRFVADGLL